MTAFPFDNSYARLPEKFYSRVAPTPVAAPALIAVNRPLAKQLGIDPDWLASAEGVAVVAGNALPEGAEPIATVYAGHQFGSYNPQLGDGRAVLLGEVVNPSGNRLDVQLKGAGPTPYSRGGDGRSPLGPVLREYLLSEAMHTLGIPSTRALAAVTTGDEVVREEFLPGAILARVASSHIRIGTFQFFSASQDNEALAQLLQHVAVRHFPNALVGDNLALGVLHAVINAQARLVAKWQLVGFIHGVMNTDNMLLSGETIDYGPCAFMDTFKPDMVYSSIDHAGRYAYRNQPGIAHWNLACLAQSLVPLLHEDKDEGVALAQKAIDTFPETFVQAHTRGMASKLGLQPTSEESGEAQDAKLVEDLFALMAQHDCDFTLTFRRLADLAGSNPDGAGSIGSLFDIPDPMLPWLSRWRARLDSEPAAAAATRQSEMYRANPVFIPRNHLVQEVIEAATTDRDLDPFHQLAQVLARPCEFDASLSRYARPPDPEQVVRRTFCGT